MVLKEVKPEDITDVLAEEELEPFDLDEMPLPRDYFIEVMAREALGYAKMIQQARMSIAGNKAVHNDSEVKRLSDIELSSRIALSKIKKEYPEALKRVAALAQMEADRGKQEGS